MHIRHVSLFAILFTLQYSIIKKAFKEILIFYIPLVVLTMKKRMIMTRLFARWYWIKFHHHHHHDVVSDCKPNKAYYYCQNGSPPIIPNGIIYKTVLWHMPLAIKKTIFFGNLFSGCNYWWMRRYVSFSGNLCLRHYTVNYLLQFYQLFC